MTIDIDALEALAKAATPGPWKESLYPFFIQAGDYQLANITSKNAGDDSAYIAAANPAVVLELVAETRRQRKAMQRLARALRVKNRALALAQRECKYAQERAAKLEVKE